MLSRFKKISNCSEPNSKIPWISSLFGFRQIVSCKKSLLNARIYRDFSQEIAILPEGSITKKKIKDKEYYYHRMTQNGKRVENLTKNMDVF